MNLEIIDKYIATCPVPYLYKMKNHDGMALHIDRYCENCKNKLCQNCENIDKLYSCPSKMLYYICDVWGEKLLLYGFTTKQEEYSRNKIAKEKYDSWLNGLFEIMKHLNDYDKMKWAPLHDLTPCIALLFRNIETIVAKYPGRTLNEKIENTQQPVDPLIITLFKTASLFAEQVKMTRYLFCPEQISAGKKSAFPVYKVADKFTKIFRPIAKDNNLSISFAGTSYNAPLLSDSFSAVLFILFDNAIKYTLPETEVLVEINDLDNGGVELSVASLSLKCDDDIFNKFHRGEYSTRVTDRGMGMGLYVAKLICEHNNAKLNYSEDCSKTVKSEDVIYCYNTFSVIVNR